LPLPSPELYDLENDPDESYDVAPEHPAVVTEILGKVDPLIAGFPEEVRKAYRQTREKKVENTSGGQLPSEKKP
jgi:hypothetical protein